MQTYSDQWIVPADLKYFAGHFPGRPVLPAVITVQFSFMWLKAILRHKTLQLQELTNAKFVNPILPSMVIERTAAQVDENQWQIELTEQGSGIKLASLRLVVSA